MEEKYLEAHQFSSRHRKKLEMDTTCGCFYCVKIFHPDQIADWCDDEDTAICPYCGIDAVIGESSGFPITNGFLKEMHDVFF